MMHYNHHYIKNGALRIESAKKLVITSSNHSNDYIGMNKEMAAEDENVITKIANMQLKELWIIIIFNLTAFQMILQELYKPFSYIDEFLSLLFFLHYLIKKTIRSKDTGAFSTNEKWCMGLMVLVVCIGFISNWISNLNIKIAPILVDCFTCSKFILILILFSGIYGKLQMDRIITCLTILIKIYVIIIFFLLLWNLIFDIGMSSNARYGLNSYKFIFPHQTFLASTMCGFLALLTLKKGNGIYIFLTIVIILSTIRIKAIGFVVTYIWMAFHYRHSNKLKLIHFVTISIIMVVLAWNQIKFYYIGGEVARSALNIASIKIASAFFPFGTGFASFASYMSGIYYSPVYYIFHLSNVYGLSPSHLSFLSDTFWPVIIGQFGWLGFGVFCAIIVNIYKLICVKSINNNKKIFSALSILSYILISSTSESSFFNPISVYLFFVLSIILQSNEIYKEKNMVRSGNKLSSRFKYI